MGHRWIINLSTAATDLHLDYYGYGDINFLSSIEPVSRTKVLTSFTTLRRSKEYHEARR